MSFKKDIEDLVKISLKSYQDDPDNFLREYNLEKEFTKEYQGRQLLELLQNADDEGSKKVLIEWKTSQQTLSISNTGSSFTIDGIKSLMRAGLSSKTKIKYIGNKGLGFRSLLNWANEIHIYTNGCKISFSEGIARDYFENELGLTQDQKSALRRKRNLAHTAIPFPTLAIPKVEELPTASDWSTIIEISYKEGFGEDIGAQLSEITEEILLFLNNISTIQLLKEDGDNKYLESSKASFADYDFISIGKRNWKVFKQEDVLPDEYQDKSKEEKQSYNIKVAFQDDLSDKYSRLFNYFPTELSISLPCIIHGTFELNSSRNHLNNSKKNEYILKQLVGLLRKCALFLTKDGINWRPYKLLTPTSKKSDSKLVESFYKNLDELKATEVIYPSIYSRYNSLDNAVYYSDDFSSFFANNFPEVFPELLIPLQNEVENVFEKDTFTHSYLVEKVDELSNREMPIITRADLIGHLVNIVPANNDNEKFSLLVNDKGKIISKQKTAFTPSIRSDENLSIPVSVSIDFMNSDLYDLLLVKFEEKFDKKEPKAREIQRIIKSVVNVQPYDSNNVIDRIITSTKEIIEKLKGTDEKVICVKEMVYSLYANFITIDSRQNSLRIDVPLISKAGTLQNAADLFLSASYPSGNLTEEIYGKYLKQSEYLAESSVWNLVSDNSAQIEKFFLWLGVNQFSKFSQIRLSNNWQEKSYTDFLFNSDVEFSPDFNMSRVLWQTVVTRLDNFEVIKKLPLNKIILLSLKDSTIRRNLEQNDEIIQWQYNYWRSIKSQYSYIRYQFIVANLFTSYILEEGGEEINKLINDDLHIDYEYLERFGFNRIEIRAILIKLGAKESFNEVEPQQVYNILKSIPIKDTERQGRGTQTIYRMALECLVRQESTLPVPNHLLLFCRKGETFDYIDHSSIYYSDNAILPRRILNTLPLLNLPKRVGEDNVERYLGVKSLREFKIQLAEDQVDYHPCDNDINKEFDNIKPYILAYRLESSNLKKRVADQATRRKEANALKHYKIRLVKECFFLSGNKKLSIEEKEFLNVDGSFYYKECSISNISDLKKDSLFCDAFAEMMCIIFKVNDLKNDFRQIFKNDLQDTIHLATQDLGENVIEECFRLLGISRIEVDFWKRIYYLKGKHLKEPIDSTNDLRSKVFSDLGFIINDDYDQVEFETFKNKPSFNLISQLCRQLGVTVSDITNEGLTPYHKGQFQAALKDLEFSFRCLLWTKLNADSTRQKEFIGILDNYNFEFIEKIVSHIHQYRYFTEVDYHSIIKELIQVEYCVDFTSPVCDQLIFNRYESLLIKYDVEEGDLEIKYRSLLYFEGNDEVIEKYLISKFVSLDESEDSNSDNDNTKVVGTLINASISKNGKIGTSTSTSTPSSWIHSSSNEKGKRKKGKISEQLVYNTLKEQFGPENVKWVSGNSTTPDKSDNLHYDIEYRNEIGEWKYLEVKSVSNGQFTITESEKEKGLQEPDKYEMALVEDKNIYIVKDVFKFKSGESFSNNSKFSAFPKDYIFTFDISQLKTN